MMAENAVSQGIGVDFVPNTAPAGFQTLYGLLLKGDSRPAVNKLVQFSVSNENSLEGEILVQQYVQDVLTDENGIFQAFVPQGVFITIDIRRCGVFEIFTTEDSAKNLADYFDSYEPLALQTVSGQILKGDGSASTDEIEFKITYEKTVVSGAFYQHRKAKASLDAQGNFQIPVPCGAMVTMFVPEW